MSEKSLELDAPFRKLFEFAPVAYHEIDAAGTLCRVNQAEHRLFGYTAADMIGRPVWHFAADDQQESWRRTIERRISGHEEPNLPLEIDCVRRDGGYLILEIYDSLIRGCSGQITGIRSVLLDVTDRRIAEQLLANEVTERERLTVALRQSKEEAETANRSKSEFLSRMSHELRTPLNAILGFGQLLEMGPLDGDKREAVAQILKAGQHLLGLINEVLEISRIEAGRLSLAPEAVEVGAAVQETLDLLTPLAKRRSVALRDELVQDRRHLLADPQRLKQVLLNLISNAIKYNCEAGIVTISAEQTGENQLRIKVRDTGPGIQADKQSKLFAPFERLGAEQTGVEGTGLGLAVSKRLLEVMGGSIGVENNADRGATFWLELPLAPDLVPQAEAAIVRVPVAANPVARQCERTVLYVEDNLSNLTLIEHIIAHRPHVKLVAAMQGRLGLELAREHRPDLILLDLHLPDISGEEVLQQLRQEPELRNIRVIVISADATRARIERLLGMGVLDYLPKPLDVKKFLQLLDSCLTEMNNSQ